MALEEKKKIQSVNEVVVFYVNMKAWGDEWPERAGREAVTRVGKARQTIGEEGSKLERQTPLDNRHKIRMRCSWRAKL